MAKIDPFTTKRILKFAREYRETHAQLPTLKDFENSGFDPAIVESLVTAGDLVQLYVTMTTGAIVKGYKPKD